MNDRARLSALLDPVVETALAERVAPAVTVVVAHEGERVYERVAGHLATVDDEGRRLEASALEPADADTAFDLASVTKVYSAHTLLTLVTEGSLDLDRPLAEWLGEYESGHRSRVTLRHLLTHTSGLPATWSGWRAPFEAASAATDDPGVRFTATPLTDRESLVADLLGTPLRAAPGEHWEYACTGFNTAMALAEKATGEHWGDLVRRTTLVPLGLSATTFAPLAARTAATEYQPELRRGVVRGNVHDESSWSLGGEAANAGLFATASDVLALAESLRVGRTPPMAAAMWDDQLPRMLGGRPGPGHGAGLGLRIGESAWMGRHGARSRGHNGFTGTSIQIDREARTSIVILTNRVHPSRDTEGTQALRAAVADIVLEVLSCP